MTKGHPNQYLADLWPNLCDLVFGTKVLSLRICVEEGVVVMVLLFCGEEDKHMLEISLRSFAVIRS